MNRAVFVAVMVVALVGGGCSAAPESEADSEVVDHSAKPKCPLGPQTCEGNGVVTCLPDKSGYGAPTACAAGTVCNQGFCGPCQPGRTFCQGRAIVECSGGGKSAEPVSTCGGDEVCFLGACMGCLPNSRECRTSAEGVAQAWLCKEEGQSAAWAMEAACTNGAECAGGICIQPCQTDTKLNSNRGCDYYAVDLPNLETSSSGGPAPADQQFAVVVSNPSREHTLEINVRQTPDGDPVTTRSVAPGTLEKLVFAKRNVSGTTLGALAWRIDANLPFVAYQFNPLDNTVPVFSNDASLLLPTNALGKVYRAVTGKDSAFVTVVGTRANTVVTVTVTAPTYGDSASEIP